MDPFGAGRHCTDLNPTSHISSTHYTGKYGARVRMNVVAHQKEKTRKREAGVERKQATDFKDAACYLLRLFRRKHGEKNYLREGVPGVTEILGKANSHFDPTQTGLGTAPSC